jgi:hypothetical protein
MHILKAGVVYFAVVFGTGFVLGTIRTLWIVPRLGVRAAELLETPFMVVAIVLTASWFANVLAILAIHQPGLLSVFLRSRYCW